MSIEAMGALAGSIMAVISLVAFVVRPVISAFNKTTDALTKINHTLDLLNRDLEDSKSDRSKIHDELDKHEKQIGDHTVHLVKHDEQIKTLFGQKVGGKR